MISWFRRHRRRPRILLLRSRCSRLLPGPRRDDLAALAGFSIDERERVPSELNLRQSDEAAMWSKGEARRRSGKFWNGVHKAASSLEAVAGKSRVSMATALIVPASLLLMMPTRMEVAMADPVMT